MSNTIESAQKRLEGNNFERRKTVIRYDDVMNQQRKIIYAQRREVLEGADLKERIMDMTYDIIDGAADEFCSAEEVADWNFDGLREHFKSYLLASDSDNFKGMSVDEMKGMLRERADKIYEEKEKLFGENMREVERIVLLRTVDENWVEQIDAMHELQNSVQLRAYAQRDPIVDYRMEGAEMFDAMIQNIKETTVRRLIAVVPRKEPMRRVQIIRGDVASIGGDASSMKKKPVVKNKAEKIGRNEPCPCGSGKKYKKCCGLNTEA